MGAGVAEAWEGGKAVRQPLPYKGRAGAVRSCAFLRGTPCAVVADVVLRDGVRPVDSVRGTHGIRLPESPVPVGAPPCVLRRMVPP